MNARSLSHTGLAVTTVRWIWTAGLGVRPQAWGSNLGNRAILGIESAEMPYCPSLTPRLSLATARVRPQWHQSLFYPIPLAKLFDL